MEHEFFVINGAVYNCTQHRGYGNFRKTQTKILTRPPPPCSRKKKERGGARKSHACGGRREQRERRDCRRRDRWRGCDPGAQATRDRDQFFGAKPARKRRVELPQRLPRSWTRLANMLHRRDRRLPSSPGVPAAREIDTAHDRDAVALEARRKREESRHEHDGPHTGAVPEYKGAVA